MILLHFTDKNYFKELLFKHGQTNFEMFPETGSLHTPFLSCFVLISKIYLQSGFKLEPISYRSQ